MINESIAGYRIIRELGRGGMATVYLAEHELLRKKFAFKILHFELARNSGIRQRFIKEARIMADMSHTGIVKVNNLIDAGDIVAMVMEYIDGDTLKEYVNLRKRLSDSEIKGIFIQMLKAVEYVHSNRIVHRDLKPANFMIDRAGQIKLMDFGIAKSMGSDYSDFTQTGSQMGTVMYMSPEQLENSKDIGTSSDIYSMGVLLWQLVTGKKPYDSSTLNSFQIQKKIQDEPLPKTNTHWDSIIQRATAKKPSQRFRTISEFTSTIHRAARNEQEETVLDNNRNSATDNREKFAPRKTSNRQSTINKYRIHLIAAGAAFCIAAIAVVLLKGDENPTPPLPMTETTQVEEKKTISIGELEKMAKEELDKHRNTTIEGFATDTTVRSEKDPRIVIQINKGVFADYKITEVPASPDPPQPTPPPANPKSTPAKKNPGDLIATHTVRKGETLPGIAIKYAKSSGCRVTVDGIIDDNKRESADKIKIGERLKIICH